MPLLLSKHIELPTNFGKLIIMARPASIRVPLNIPLPPTGINRQLLSGDKEVIPGTDFVFIL
jgi:hypothetical protein